MPYWDFDAAGIPDAHRDASAAAITASALLELGGFVEDSLRTEYRDEAERILHTLSGPPYRTRGDGTADSCWTTAWGTCRARARWTSR